jgi:fermentation-respiration switch protein FrsA (DUF1100 family)
MQRIELQSLKTMLRRTLYLVGGALIAGIIVAAVLAIRFGPTLALSLTLALPESETWLRDPAREEITILVNGRQLHADVYRPAKPRAALLLVHGLSRAGRRHPDLVRFARALARHGEVVLVPEFEGLTAFRLTGREVEEIRGAFHYLTRATGSVGIAGFSFGAGPALLAAADLPRLRLVGSFGGYADLRNVIAYITTGVHAFRGERYVQRQEEYNRWKLLSLLAVYVEHERDRQLLQGIAERKLANPAENTSALEARLERAGRSVLNLALNRREEAVAKLFAALPASVREALDSLSPLSRVPRISSRLLIAHGAGDDSIPFTESLRLAEAASGRSRVVILQTFHHTGPKPFWESLGLRARDGLNLLRLADDLLAQ